MTRILLSYNIVGSGADRCVLRDEESPGAPGLVAG